jgi:lipoate-protein ligase B
MGTLDMRMSGDRTTPCGAESVNWLTLREKKFAAVGVVIRTDDGAAVGVALNVMNMRSRFASRTSKRSSASRNTQIGR